MVLVLFTRLFGIHHTSFLKRLTCLLRMKNALSCHGRQTLFTSTLLSKVLSYPNVVMMNASAVEDLIIREGGD